MLVAKGLALARLQPVETEAGVLGLQIPLREAGLHLVGVAEILSRVLDLLEPFMGEGVAHPVLSVADVESTLPVVSSLDAWSLPSVAPSPSASSKRWPRTARSGRPRSARSCSGSATRATRLSPSARAKRRSSTRPQTRSSATARPGSSAR